jgi:hypothetical protein
MTLAQARAHIGAGVVYRPGHGPVEDGVITGVGPTLVFVRYAGDIGSKGTQPEHLDLTGAAR